MLSILSTLVLIIPAVIFLLGMWQYSLKGSVRTEETGKLAQEMGLEFTEKYVVDRSWKKPQAIHSYGLPHSQRFSRHAGSLVSPQSQ